VIAAVNVSTHAGRRTLEAIVADLLSPLRATAAAIEGDLVSAHQPGAWSANRDLSN